MNVRKLNVGDKLDIWDKYDLWFPADVTEIDNSHITIHYPGWPSSYDERIPIQNEFETDEITPRYAPIHSQTFKCIHISAICPLNVNFRLGTNHYHKIQLIPYSISSTLHKHKHFILIYDGLSLYRFNAIKHKYSRKTFIDFTAQKAPNSDYRLLHNVTNHLYFLNLHKSICYKKRIHCSNVNKWKHINVNMPSFKSYIISNGYNNEWYIIGAQYNDINIHTINKYYDELSYAYTVSSELLNDETKQSNINDNDHDIDDNDLGFLYNAITVYNRSQGQSINQIANLSANEIDILVNYALRRRLRTIQNQLDALYDIVELDEKKEELQQNMSESLKIIKIRLDAQKGIVTLLNENVINNYKNFNPINVCHRNKLIYIASQHKLMIFGDNYKNKESDNIWIMDLCPMNGKYKWKLYPLKLPHKKKANATDWMYHLVFDCLIFVFYFMPNCNQDIWILDLLSHKWFKCNVKYLPYCFNNEFPFTLKTNDNYLHSMSVGSHKSHTKIAFMDLIPDDLYKTYFEYYYHNSVSKWIHQIERKYQLSVPGDITKVIMNYYPIFY